MARRPARHRRLDRGRALAHPGGDEPGRDRPPALRVAFARFPQLARVLGTGPALELLKEDLADATSDRVLEVLILAHERGGAIVREILDDLVDATTRDLKLLDELETEGLEMRINARGGDGAAVARARRVDRAPRCVPRLLPVVGRGR